MKYAKSTGGFYDEAIHGKRVPVDAVDIADAEYAALMLAQSQGKVIVSGEFGPVAVAPTKTTAELDAEQTEAAKRRLKEIDDASIRSIREWLAAQPDAPQFVKNHEAAAIAERSKIK